MRRFAPIVLSIVVLATILVIWLSRPKREDDIAKEAGRCFLAADFHCLMALASPEEKEAFNLSPDQLDKLSAFARQNGIGSLSQVSIGATNYFAPSAQGGFSVDVETRNKQQLTLTFQVERTKSGSFYPFTHSLLKFYYVRIRQEQETRLDGLAELVAVREHIRKHAGEYQELGLMGHYSIKANGLVPFDEVAARYDRIEQQVLAERQKSP
ncbi:MAG: hypothetical protein LCH41_14815 [Armatimonadetes bacterium]|nr:hypothetical protein [Armatimonadota bacterium]